MERVLNVLTLEVKKSSFLKDTLISIFIIEILSFVIYLFYNKLSVPASSLGTVPYLSLMLFAYSMAREYSSRTDKILFTGAYTRTEIIISKLISFCVINILFFIVNGITAVIYSVISHSEFKSYVMPNSLYVFVLYAFVLGSFIILVSSIVSDVVAIGLVSYVLFFDLTLVILSEILEKSKNESLKWLVVHSPNYILNTGFKAQNYTLTQSAILIISGIIFLLIGIFIIRRKDL